MRWLALGIVVLAGTGCGIAAYYFDQKNELVVDRLQVDLGECPQGSYRELKFTVTNHTWDEIEVVEIVKTCGCMENSISKSQLGHNDSCDLKVQWNLGQQRGKRHLPVLVTLRNKTQNTEFSLVLQGTATVRGHIEFDSSQLEFDAHQPATQYIQVAYTSKYRVLGVGTLHPALQAKWDETRKRIEVHYDQSKLSAVSGIGYLFVETDKEEEKNVRIPVMIR